MTTDIPENITTPDKVETRLGTLKFFDGLPDDATVQRVYDNLDFMRGVEVFLNTLSATSSLASFRGLRSVGAGNQTVVLHQDRVDARTLLLTPNTQTATLWGVLDLKDGPIVVEVPPGVLGLADDAWMRYIVDMGLVGPDKGQGGKYLFLPPGYEGDVPEGYFVAQSQTYNLGYGLRGFTEAVAVGNATARALAFPARDDAFCIYPGESAWFNAFVGGSHEFIKNNVRLIDARTCFMYIAAGITSAMSMEMVGAGSQYAVVVVDVGGEYLDGSKNYRLHLPPNIPVKTFWSLIPWIQTVPGKGWFTILRLCGPLEPWFDKTWRPGEIAKVD